MPNLFQKFKKSLLGWLKRPEYVYLYLAVLGVIGFVFITPPFQGPDEQAHYVRVQYIANGYFLPVNAEKAGATLPSSIDEVAKQTFYNNDLRGDTNEKYNLHETRAALNIPYQSGEESQPIMVAYSPIPYLPAVPFVAISNHLNLSPLISMYLARLALGITSILIFFLAIRLLPHKKYFFVVIGLIPMMLFQQAMITADSISYAFLALFIAYVLYLRNLSQASLTKRQWLYVGLLCLIITVSKPLVFLFLPLVLLLINKKNAFKWIISIGAACAVLLVVWMLISGSASETDGVIEGKPTQVDSAAQTKLIEENPKRALRVMWNSYMTPFGDDEVRGVIGIFGAADTVYPLWMFTLYAIMLGIFAAITSDKKINLPKRWQILTLIIGVVYFLAVNYALYTGFTPVDFNIVYGVQGRYFLPILIASVVIFAGGIYVTRKEFNRFIPKSVAVLFVLIILALFITLQRYYLYTP